MTDRYGEKELEIDEKDRQLLQDLMYGRESGSVKRFTQDSPILPDVWMTFFDPARETVDLLLTPFRGTPPGELARVVRERVKKQRGGAKARADVSYNQAAVAAKLSFEELIRVVLPLTRWWNRHVWASEIVDIDMLRDKASRHRIAAAIANPEAKARETGVTPDLLWTLRVVGAIARRRETGSVSYPTNEAEWLELVEAVARVVRKMKKSAPEDVAIWNVTRNRRAELTIYRSSLAVKADAAVRLFDIKCNRLNWAVVDSGIDARHIAFQRNPKAAAEQDIDDPERLANTRVKETYDFTVVRDLLNLDALDKDELPPHLVKARKNRRRKEEIDDLVSDLRKRLQRGQNIDWTVLGPLVRIEHERGRYRPPEHDHGTHVAGILAADWPEGDDDEGVPVDVCGICPDLNLYDFRVLGADGAGDEFSIIAALQFIRHLNANRDAMVIHGANVSISMKHDVSNYACGRTPVCEECDRVVAAGVVVVAAAGNLGYHRIRTERGFTEGYHSVSITDPGNADAVITVGSTHRQRPHTYGVSYFSSRGPTGDGRLKPDLVAPGEKIRAPIPGDDSTLKDGTSMAAPHVSGAAALLMARHSELVGRPDLIKKILCDTATDLHRERYFQGTGMLDILRALQSV